MKKYILKEQTDTKIVSAPSDELYLLNQDIFKGKGTLVNLSIDTNGDPKQVKVGRKTYTAGLKTDKGNYVVYDGRILTYSSDKGYQYFITPSGKIGMVKGSVDKNLNNSYLNLLSQFGISNVKNLYSVLDQARERMQTLINKGAVGDVFRDFNEILRWYYPNDETKQLKPPAGKTFNQTIDKNELNSNYELKSLSQFGLEGNYYALKSAPQANLVLPKNSELNETICKETIINYLRGAISTVINKKDGLNNAARQDYKTQILACYNSGFYQKLKLKIDDFVDPTDPDNTKINILKKLSPYGILNKNLNYNEIKRYLNKELHTGWVLKEENTREKTIDGKVRRALNEQLLKQKKLITERRLVESRLKFLANDYNKKYSRLTEQQKIILSFRILREISFLSEENLINEQLLDFVKNLFGNLLPSGLETIVERVVNSILSKLGFGDGYIQKFFVSLIATRPTEFFKALKNCQDLTKLISRSIVEAMVMKLQENLNKGGNGYDLLRNLLGNSIQEQPFVDAVEANISSKICEIYNKYLGKAKSVVNTLGG